jgi:pyruvate ferredoxin oxidoreductase gamma subunit
LWSTTRSPSRIERKFGAHYQFATIDATSIAREYLGRPIVNTTMMGALVKATSVVRLESLFQPLRNRFNKLADKNIDAMRKAYNETRLKVKA